MLYGTPSCASCGERPRRVTRSGNVRAYCADCERGFTPRRVVKLAELTPDLRRVVVALGEANKKAVAEVQSPATAVVVEGSRNARTTR